MPVQATQRRDEGPDERRRFVIDRIPSAWYRPRKVVYWTDFLASALIGWSAFLACSRVVLVWRAPLFLIATFALYRAALFTHELTHLRDRALPHFELAWNALIGVPFLIPSFLYRGVHLDHHRATTYGTSGDPEYLPFTHERPRTIALYLGGAVLFPIAAVVRFALLAPASLIHTRLRRSTLERFSALAINSEYRRSQFPHGQWRLQEAACAALCWGGLAGRLAGWIPSSIILRWAAIGIALSLLNAFRALAAHRYDGDGRVLTLTEQLRDSCTLRPKSRMVMAGVLSAPQVLVAPVGLRYHALHHWIPTLPYHSLGKAHRLLLRAAEGFEDYNMTLRGSVTSTIVALVRSSMLHMRRR